MPFVKVLGKTLDVLVRIAATLTAIGTSLMVLFISAMGADSPDGSDLLIGTAIAIVGFTVELWVILCTILPVRMDRMLRSLWRPLRILLTIVPVYAMACVGVSWWVNRLLLDQRMKLPVTQLVAPGDPQYPIINPNPQHLVEVEGTLPSTLPVQSFVAVYASSGCKRMDHEVDGHEVRPLVMEQILSVVRQKDHYKVAVAVDAVEPGHCGWHLRDVTYALGVKGYKTQKFRYYTVGPRLEVMPLGTVIHLENQLLPPYRGPMNVWCWNTDKDYNPYYPITCADQADAPIRHVPLTVPDAERDAHGVVAILPDTRQITFNFHEVGKGWTSPGP